MQTRFTTQWELIKLRKIHNMNQEELAEVIGITPGSYRNKESGKTQFKADEMFLIARYFDRKIEDIFLPGECISNAVEEAEHATIERDTFHSSSL